MTDTSSSLTIKHNELGITFPSIPFIWHYNDFANPYPTQQYLFHLFNLSTYFISMIRL